MQGSASLTVAASFGVGCPTTRACRVWQDDSGDSGAGGSHIVDVPMGLGLVRWNVDSSTRLCYFQAHHQVRAAFPSPHQSIVYTLSCP